MFHLLSLLGFKMLKGAKVLFKIATAKGMMRKGDDCGVFLTVRTQKEIGRLTAGLKYNSVN